MMIDPQTARQKIHELIDAIPDEQITMVWMMFQNMLQMPSADPDANFGDDSDDLIDDESDLDNS